MMKSADNYTNQIFEEKTKFPSVVVSFQSVKEQTANPVPLTRTSTDPFQFYRHRLAADSQYI